MEWSIKRLIEIASQYDSVLDIGCGRGGLIRRIRAKVRIGVDACERALEIARRRSSEVDYRCIDLKHIEKHFNENSIECITGIDIIEHLEKEDALLLIQKCELIATKRILFFIPVGYHPQTNDPWNMGNEFHQTHKSIWYPEDMEKLGYEVTFYPNWHKNIKPPKEKGAMWCLKIMD